MGGSQCSLAAGKTGGCVPSGSESSEQTPLTQSISGFNHIWVEIDTASQRMADEGKSLDELREHLSPKSFQILHAYLRSECPREFLLALYAKYLFNDEDRMYLTAIATLLKSAEKCSRCS